MSIPVPEYISYISKVVKSTKTNITVSINCECGCNEFFIYKNKITNEERDEIKKAENKMRKTVGIHTLSCESDKNGNVRWYIKRFFFFKQNIILPEFPYYVDLAVYKVKCSICNNEYLIFDNRIHGYDAIIESTVSDKLKNHIFEFIEKDLKNRVPIQIHIKYENHESLDEFNEPDDTFDFHTYSNAFKNITIYAVDKAGKKTAIYSEETA